MATSAADLAAEFGYSISFFKSQPELYKLLKTAVSEDYTPARFVAALQNTKWFRVSSEAARKYTMLKSSDPATFKQQLSSITAHILNQGGAMGAILTVAEARKLADTSLRLGWNEDQLKRYLVNQLDYNKKGGYYYGRAGAAQAQIEGMAKDYGVSVSPAVVKSYVSKVVLGQADQEDARAMLQRQASSKYVALKDRIMAGETVRDIADPYIQSYGKLLEVNGENINLDDQLIQQALQSKDAKGQPATLSVWEFEQKLRSDKRWAQTQNAQNQMTSVASDILKQFGLVT